MSRLPFILLMVLMASSVTVNAQRRYYEDFRGQSFCAKRMGSREGQCCTSRYDECSVPIAGNNSIRLRHPSLTNQSYFQVHYAIVMSSVISISIRIAVPIMRIFVKAYLNQSPKNVKSEEEFSLTHSRKKKSTAIYGKNLFIINLQDE